MLTYKNGDYLFAKDENKIYKITQLPCEGFEYYNGTQVGGSSGRGFSPNATHHRLATEEEVNAAYRKEKVLKVKRNTEAWELLYKIFHYHKKWSSHKSEIEEFLGFEMEGNLYHSLNPLCIKRNMVKEEWEDQFRKNSNPAKAKVNSKINKQWVALCKKLGLEVYDLHSFRIKYGLYFHGFTVHNFNDDYYIEFEDGLAGGGLYNWLEVVDESDFLRIRAIWLDYRKKEEEDAKV